MFILAFLFIESVYGDVLSNFQTYTMIFGLSIDGGFSVYMLEKYSPDPEVFHQKIIKYSPLVLIQFIIFVVGIIIWRYYLYSSPAQLQYFKPILMSEIMFTFFFYSFFWKRSISYMKAVQFPSKNTDDAIETHASIKKARQIIFILLLIPIVIVYIILSSVKGSLLTF